MNLITGFSHQGQILNTVSLAVRAEVVKAAVAVVAERLMIVETIAESLY